MNGAFIIVSKKSLPQPRSSKIFFSMLSSIDFIVLHFTFRSMINVELIFVKDVRCVSRFFFSFLFFFLNVDDQLLQNHLLKRLSLLHCIAFAPLSKISDCIYGSLFLGSLLY